MRIRLFSVLFGAIFSSGMLGCGLTMMRQKNVSKHWKSIEYANESPAQNLDIFLPKTVNSPYPTILYIHGGGFMAGNKYGGANAIAQPALLKGYAFVTIDYRLSGEALFPAAVNDSLKAVQFLKANAEAYGIDSNKIAVWGSSAERGQIFSPQCELTEPDPDILCEYDVQIPMSESFFVQPTSIDQSTSLTRVNLYLLSCVPTPMTITSLQL